jgi:hypothetical protein
MGSHDLHEGREPELEWHRQALQRDALRLAVRLGGRRAALVIPATAVEGGTGLQLGGPK